VQVVGGGVAITPRSLHYAAHAKGARAAPVGMTGFALAGILPRRGDRRGIVHFHCAARKASGGFGRGDGFLRRQKVDCQD